MSFPSNPTNGQLATVNGVVYSYSTSKSAWTVTTSTQAALAGTSIAVTTTAAVGSTLTVTGTSTLASATFSGTASAAGNIIGGNILTSGVLTASTISSTGYISQSRSDDTMARIIISNTNRNWTISNYGTSYSPNGAFAIADETGAVVRFRITPGANTDITGNVVASGNVTAPYFLGNGSLLTGLSTTSISSGTSSVTVVSSAGNVTQTVGGTVITTARSTGFAISSSLSVGNTVPSGTTGEIRATNAITAFYSDRRLKNEISKIENALDKVNQLTGVIYTQNKLAEQFGYNNYEEQVGLYAQDVNAVQPQAVKPAPFDVAEDGTSRSGENYLTVQYDKLVPLLVEAIKELRAEVRALKGE